MSRGEYFKPIACTIHNVHLTKSLIKVLRKEVGYLRYDTESEREILSQLYQNELRLFKNFFQPVMKLVSKTRIQGKIHKKYDRPKTPYQRLIESNDIAKEKKKELQALYKSLNPGELRRTIEKKSDMLQKAHDHKKRLVGRDKSLQTLEDFGVKIGHVSEAISVS